MRLTTLTATIILFSASAAFGQTPAGTSTGANGKTSSMPAGKMTTSAGHTKETKMDKMMVKNCMAMTKDKMMKDAECQDYMKNHPDWMKSKK